MVDVLPAPVCEARRGEARRGEARRTWRVSSSSSSAHDVTEKLGRAASGAWGVNGDGTVVARVLRYAHRETNVDVEGCARFAVDASPSCANTRVRHIVRMLAVAGTVAPSRAHRWGRAARSTRPRESTRTGCARRPCPTGTPCAARWLRAGRLAEARCAAHRPSSGGAPRAAAPRRRRRRARRRRRSPRR
eukprot:6654089-Prymnesium_polylepis.1